MSSSTHSNSKPYHRVAWDTGRLIGNDSRPLSPQASFSRRYSQKLLVSSVVQLYIQMVEFSAIQNSSRIAKCPPPALRQLFPCKHHALPASRQAQMLLRRLSTEYLGTSPLPWNKPSSDPEWFFLRYTTTELIASSALQWKRYSKEWLLLR